MSLAQYLLDIIFPPTCLACKNYLKDEREKSNHLCATCSGKLEYLPGFLCPVCFRRLSSSLPAEAFTRAGASVKEDWPSCHKDARFILAAPLHYDNPITQELIQTLKYGGLKTAAEPLASVLAAYFTDSVRSSKLEIGNFVLIPLPLHPAKERKRGFNQAFVIARVLRRNLLKDFAFNPLEGLPILSEAIVKTKNTPSQTEKEDYEARAENVRGVFKVKKPELVAGKDILLVDDVFTSGATMREAVRALKSAGAKRSLPSRLREHESKPALFF